MDAATGQPEAERHLIATTVHGELQIAAPPGDGPHPLLVGFHGYGETAADHLAELRRIPGAERWLLCAVQGLNLFYRKSGQQVVASWMTRRNRERVIADNVAYAGAAVDEVRRRYPTTDTLVYSGFSQGVAMTYRAATLAGRGCHGVIALAGDVPPELDRERLAAIPSALIGRGRGDTWYTEDKQAADMTRLAGAGVAVESFVFNAGHVWEESFRQRAGSYLERLIGG